MKKTFYIVRHCKASGQEPNDPLTKNGQSDAILLGEFLSLLNIERIICSTYLRARQTIMPFAESIDVPIELDSRLCERNLGKLPHEDWLFCLKSTFKDPDLVFPDGESTNQATRRIMSVIEDAQSSVTTNIAIVTHGNLMSLLLREIDSLYGFEEWSKLTNPDVYKLDLNQELPKLTRIWQG